MLKLFIKVFFAVRNVINLINLLLELRYESFAKFSKGFYFQLSDKQLDDFMSHIVSSYELEPEVGATSTSVFVI